ncbi:hypothetical protein [Insolitispirillum peregrinum]|uniref:Uncharacterized protein n=1 Tax=Insolitispirillum peregrinum TaxID=80876 RepID=A0A1N7JM89_9PROT|nr:hypothetical protein [Insolitispirillum peregrinum]SIS50425.1 hypothetical protein SAMN05421779_102380 [Insolitispirillum peregrinum]
MTTAPTETPFLLPLVLQHNPAVARALRAVAADVDQVSDWWGLSGALAGHVADLVAFPGNKSERLMLAAVLVKADYADAACQISPDFWRAWSGLDRRNKRLIMALLEEDLALLDL